MPRRGISSANAKHEKLIQTRAIKRGLLSPEEVLALVPGSSRSNSKSRAADGSGPGVKSHLSKSARDGTGSAENVKKGRRGLESRFALGAGVDKEEKERRKFEVLEECLVRPIPIERAVWQDPGDLTSEEATENSLNAAGPSTSTHHLRSSTTTPPSTDLSNYSLSALSSLLSLPTRPAWHHTTTSIQLDRNESAYFSKWIAGIDAVQAAWVELVRKRRRAWELNREEGEGREMLERLEGLRGSLRPRGQVVVPQRAGMSTSDATRPSSNTDDTQTYSRTQPLPRNAPSSTPKPSLPSPSYFERNLQVWRQFWRVSERSQIILVLLDARCPALHFSQGLRRWLRDEMGLTSTADARGLDPGVFLPGAQLSKQTTGKRLKAPLSNETKTRIAESARLARERRRTHVPSKRVIIVLTKVDLVEPEVVKAWVGWCKQFWRTGERDGQRTWSEEENDKEVSETVEVHEADEIDVVCVSSYKEKDLGEDTQNLKHRRRMPHIPPTSLSSLFDALARAHEKLQTIPEQFRRATLSPADQKKKDKWERDLAGRVRREINWAGLKRGEDGSDIRTFDERTAEMDDLEVSSAGSDGSESEDSDPTVGETGSTATVVPPSRRRFDSIGEGDTHKQAGFLSIGLIGQPNIGKSSLLNALLGESRVRASKTPGKTKHFQSIFWSNEVRVVDCPGLVMPSFVPMEMQAIAGILPISQIASIPSCIYLASKLLPLERVLNLPPPERWAEENARVRALEEKKTRRDEQTEKADGADARLEPVWSAGDIMQGWAEQRGFRECSAIEAQGRYVAHGWVAIAVTAQAGRPDTNRAGNAILRMIAEGKVAWRFVPPSMPDILAVLQPGDGMWRRVAQLGVTFDDDGLADGVSQREETGDPTDVEDESASVDSGADDSFTDDNEPDYTPLRPPAGRFALLGVYEEDSEEDEDAGDDEKAIDEL